MPFYKTVRLAGKLIIQSTSIRQNLSKYDRTLTHTHTQNAHTQNAHAHTRAHTHTHTVHNRLADASLWLSLFCVSVCTNLHPTECKRGLSLAPLPNRQTDRQSVRQTDKSQTDKQKPEWQKSQTKSDWQKTNRKSHSDRQTKESVRQTDRQEKTDQRVRH